MTAARRGGMTLPAIASYFGKDHTTVIYIYVGGGLTTIGLLSVAGAVGVESAMRWLGALTALIGLMLIVVAVHRLRR